MVFWTVVKANLSDSRLDAEFNEWYNRVHVPNFVAMPGFTRAWRIRRLMHDEQRGDPGQEDDRGQWTRKPHECRR